MTTTRNTQVNRDESFDEWALRHYSASQHKLDLSYHSFWYTTGSGRYQPWHLDESFKSKLLPFMKNIGGFLEEYPFITSVSLNGMKGYWEPNIEVPQLVANPRLTLLDLGASGLTESDLPGLLDKPNLLDLSISANGIENLAFKENRNLQTLYVAGNKLNANAIGAISRLENLETLDISKNPLNDNLVGQLLTNLTHLKHVNLEDTKISKETAKTLLSNKQLTDIKVSCGEVGCWNKFKLWRLASDNAKHEKQLSKSKASFFNTNKESPAVKPLPTVRLGFK